MYRARLTKELKNLQNSGLEFSELSPREIEVTIVGPEASFYQGESFRCYFKFTENYPLEAPVVYFQDPSPMHPHIYSNGHICLSILGTGWSPALTIEKVCLSIQSMLASSEGRMRPKGDEQYCKTHPRGSDPRKTVWMYDDDEV